MNAQEMPENVERLLSESAELLSNGKPEEAKSRIIEAHTVLSKASGFVRIGEHWKRANELYRERVDELGGKLADLGIDFDSKYYYPFATDHVED